jgi:porin-like protein
LKSEDQVGAKFNTFGGSYFQFQVNYTQGAIRYAAFTAPSASNIADRFNGGSLGYGIASDGIYSTLTGDIQLTTAWGVNAAYDHFWRPDLRTSLYGSYLAVRYNDVANAAICITQVGASPPGGGISFTAPGASGLGSCSNNFNFWTVGSRTQWNITPWFYVGFDVFYQKLQSASDGAIVKYTAATTAKPTALYTIDDQDAVAFRVRVHRDIIP